MHKILAENFSTFVFGSERVSSETRRVEGPTVGFDCGTFDCGGQSAAIFCPAIAGQKTSQILLKGGTLGSPL